MLAALVLTEKCVVVMKLFLAASIAPSIGFVGCFIHIV